jgi:hypothetical protein
VNVTPFLQQCCCQSVLIAALLLSACTHMALGHQVHKAQLLPSAIHTAMLLTRSSLFCHSACCQVHKRQQWHFPCTLHCCSPGPLCFVVAHAARCTRRSNAASRTHCIAVHHVPSPLSLCLLPGAQGAAALLPLQEAMLLNWSALFYTLSSHMCYTIKAWKANRCLRSLRVLPGAQGSAAALPARSAAQLVSS